jgi:hypothetical protein
MREQAGRMLAASSTLSERKTPTVSGNEEEHQDDAAPGAGG